MIRNRRPGKKLHSKHTILDGAMEWIAEMEADPTVSGIVPGYIKWKKSTRVQGPKLIGPTSTGIRYKFHSGMAVQEFFILKGVAKQPAV